MKFLLSLSTSVLIATVLLSFLPVNGEEAIYENTIRLHVLAKSDSEEDQAMKLKVRDSVLSLLEGRLVGVNDTQTASQVIEEMNADIKKCAEEVLNENGCAEKVTVDFGIEKYPIRYYEGFTLPSGTYRSLRIIIGEGEGQNWWCILFPSVCISDALFAEKEYTEAGFTPEQYRIIDNGSPKRYKIRFKILELLAGIVGIDY
ncbi:MAG: stage II sporulation protein R [Clostridia bacterium]|nr:stage II sporulation protein R [Clostridia bacterium]